MAGRRPIPTHIKILNGNPGCRPLNLDEPKLPDMDPAADTTVPPELGDDAVACAEWRRLMPMLRASRCVTEAERSLCIALCQQWSLYLTAQQSLATEGIIRLTGQGMPGAHPAYLVASRALSHCTKLWIELGLTPSARTKVRAVGPPAKTPAERERDDYFGKASGA